MLVDHSFNSIYNKEDEILILGSFPSVKSRQKSFYYMHPQNRFWSVLAIIFNDDFINENISVKIQLLKKYHIALYDVIEQCEITNSEDNTIKSVKPSNIYEIINNSSIKKIFINGNKAYSLFCDFFPMFIPITTKLPSTSAANARYRLDDLVKVWQQIKI